MFTLVGNARQHLLIFSIYIQQHKVSDIYKAKRKESYDGVE